MLLKTCRYDLVPVRQGFDDLIDFLVVFQIFDCKITGRILVSDISILLKEHLDAVDAMLQFRSMIDMYMTGYMRIALLSQKK